MRLFGYTLRKPWVKYVEIDIDLGQELYRAVLKSLGSGIVADIITDDLCGYDCEVISYLESLVKP